MKKIAGIVKRFFLQLWRIVCYILLYNAVRYFVIIAVMIVQWTSGRTILGDDSTSVSYLLVLLMPAVITLAIMWWRLNGEWKSGGFWRFSKLSPSKLAVCAGLGLSMSLALNALIGTLLSIASSGEPERRLINSKYGFSFLAIFTGCLVIPVLEEVIFRGTVLRRLREAKVPVPVALIIQSTLFGLAHSEGVQIVYSAITSIVDGLIYLRTGSIWASIASHIAFNSLSLIFLPIYNNSG